MNHINLNEFIKQRRKSVGLTQEELSFKAGVGLRFIRELEGGKPTLQMDKVNQVLRLFGHELGPVPLNRNDMMSHEEG
ncbi:MAG: helix-turn-helix transcriptional regulator [Cyclobacteriaceae bacterium]